jgi:hypothetical protein
MCGNWRFENKKQLLLPAEYGNIMEQTEVP